MTTGAHVLPTPEAPEAVDSPCVHCMAHTPRPPWRCRVSIFIDGTGNNLYNTDTRVEEDRTIGDENHRGSYENSYSNVARLATTLEARSQVNDHHVALYVEGMGTMAGEPDDELGMGMGVDRRGVEARVDECFELLIARIAELGEGNPTLERLRIDAFGFSRGAASARLLLHRVLASEGGVVQRLAELSYYVGNLEVPFVGLFDTVSSHGPGYDDDVATLHLDALRDGRIRRVVQLAAGDEHRRNFALTDIASAGGRGEEVFLPGVHSDVGGGYNTITEGDMREHDLVLWELPGGMDAGTAVAEAAARRRQELIDLGWYTDDEITVDRGRVIANRRGIRNTYSRVPFHIMAGRAAAGGLRFAVDEYPISGDPFLVSIRGLIEHNTRGLDDWMNDARAELRRLRHGYLHFSSHCIPMLHGMLYPLKPQFHSAASAWADDEHNLMEGRRRRRVVSDLGRPGER